MKKVLAVCLMAVMLVAVSIPVSAAGCSDWDTIGVSDAWCDSNDGCGFLWAKATNKCTVFMTRTCVENNGAIIYQSTSQQSKLGCCQ